VAALDLTQFDEYFRQLHGYRRYSWQRRLAERVVSACWPPAIDLPTGSGKTACLDVAVFSLACQASQPAGARTAPVRIFFCVNRRVIVDEAHQRAKRIARKLWEADRSGAEEASVLRAVAAALRKLSGSTPEDDTPPLDVLELRGGIYRDNRWARSVLQPTIICTTVDQLGSRLLFRGYGVSNNAAPIQAALVAYDSLVLLDEAHISKPFLQTLENVHRYLDRDKWAERGLKVNPVEIVPMTATLPEGVERGKVIRLDEEDRSNESLCKRLQASKPARLEEVTDIATAAVKEAVNLGKEAPKAVGIIVNRVATARKIYEELHDKLHKGQPEATVELVIGSMRPIDRNRQAERLHDLVGPERPKISARTSLVISTQCLEVGADYDFDVLVTECASLDALRQRFGRLNRAGRKIDARAVILIEKKSVKSNDKLKDDKPEDPIYGNALARTWNWLSKHDTDGTVDFGINTFDELLSRQGEEGSIPRELLAPSALLDAPVMLPAYVDFWCQTSLRPVPDPDVSLFIHGPQHGEPDVQVCWRADLTSEGGMNPEKDWCNVVSLLPPTSPECMTVPISRLRRWLAKQDMDEADGDLLEMANGEIGPDKPERLRGEHLGVLWRGARECKLIKSPQDVRPGDTLVIPESVGGWKELGHVPRPTEAEQEPNSIDVAEDAFQQARDHVTLRIHQSLRRRLPQGSVIGELLDRATDGDNLPNNAQWRDILSTVHDGLTDDAGGFKTALSNLIASGFTCESYPHNQGVVFTSRKRLGSTTNWFLPCLDEGDDSTSCSHRQTPVLLGDHTRHVVDTLAEMLSRLPTPGLADVLRCAAGLHDLGKADERFQAMLRRTDRTDAWLFSGRASGFIAKSDGCPQTYQQRREACRRAGMPEGFRHEMLSAQLAQKTPNLPEDDVLRDLVLHLVAAHHGCARPFAPVVIDDNPPEVNVKGITLTTGERLSCPPHRLDSGIAERFWSLTRSFGWWGLAYIESLLRLADQQASAAEEAGVFSEMPNEAIMETAI